MTAVLHVTGTPRPKQSARWVNGRPVSVVATRKHLKTWTAAIIAECRRWLREGGQPLAGPLELKVEFYFAGKRAVSAPEPHTGRPDTDNLCKALMDALQAGGILADDAKIFSLWAKKWRTNSAGMVVEIGSVRTSGVPAGQTSADDLGAFVA